MTDKCIERSIVFVVVSTIKNQGFIRVNDPDDVCRICKKYGHDLKADGFNLTFKNDRLKQMDIFDIIGKKK